jgi:hypothetical protein
MTYTPDELDTFRVNEARRRAGIHATPLNIMFDVARLSREGWVPSPRPREEPSPPSEPGVK